MILILSIVLILVLTLDLLVWLVWPGRKEAPLSDPAQVPLVTVLIALRNEAHNVEELVRNLQRLDYPSSKIRFLLGDDDSSDGTGDLARKSIANDSRFQVIPVKDSLNALKGKANVIAQLIPLAQTEYLFITDADVRVPSSWIRGMMGNLAAATGVIGGCTVVTGETYWSQLQNIDWLLAQSMLISASVSVGTLAVSGTNMMITQSACKKIGGYANIPFSLTEDIGFLTAARAKGIKAQNLWGMATRATTPAQPDWLTLLKQRARWTYGAVRLPVGIVALLGLRSLFLPLLIFWAFFQPGAALVFLLAKTFLQGAIVNRLARSLQQRIHPGAMLGFEFYYALVTLGGLLLHWWPVKYSWKGRRY